jgi:NADH-quinone oxidoreductase subunit G
MPKLTIDGMEVEVVPGTSIIQAAEQLGVEIPRFCYHEKLSVPANCRMCLVEVEKSPKPVASCAMPCAEGMKVFTQSAVAQKARKGVMEMLLVNHPLDCPICDQGGECDLQDQAVAYGFDRTRYQEEKRAVKDKELGPLVKTVMTRCIQCTRCIRFGEEIAGVEELGMIGRGEYIEVGTYVAQMATSELSGNLIDVCPVGALTSKPYAFTARPWELRKTESIDVLDAVGSNIRIDCRGGEVLRVLPRLHEDINEEWISDKTRFAIDGLKNNRLDKPYVRKNGKLQPATWPEAFDAIAARLKGKGSNIGAVIGDLADCESIIALKDFLKAFGSTSIKCRQDETQFDIAQPAGYLFNTTIAGIEKADAILLVGTNPRVEAALVNARIRKTWLAKRIKIGVIGPQMDLNYPVKNLGAGPETLEELANGKGSFAEVLSKAQNPMIILGAGALRRADGPAIQALARKVAEKYNMVKEGWNGYNMLHTAASRVGSLLLGCASSLSFEELLGMDIVYLLGADDASLGKIGKSSFVIYQGHHGDKAAARADVILPGAAYTEKNATYVNLEGRPQTARQAIFPPGEAREDWKIIRALSEVVGKTLPYDNLAQVRQRLVKENPVFGDIDVIHPAKWAPFGKEGKCDKAPFVLPIDNFYMTDPITRASRVMAECTAAFAKSETKKAAHG